MKSARSVLLADLHRYRDLMYRDTLVFLNSDERLKIAKPIVIEYVNDLDFILMKEETRKPWFLCWLG